MKMKRLPLRNLMARPGRTAALALMVAFLSLSLFGGSAVVLSLRSGLRSLEARLGADIIVVPSSAKSKVNLDNLFLQGTTGYYYMDRSVLERVAARDDVERVSAQVFMASLRADCCSIPVQVIGIDQDTDFSVQPWIAESCRQRLGERDVVVGCKVNAVPGESIRIYGTNCPVVARLAPTGTGLDTAVYCSTETVALLLNAAKELGHDLKLTGDPKDVISAVYVKVQDGADAAAVAGDIKLHVRKTEAVATKSMITGVSDSLAGVSSAISMLIVVVWILAFLLLIVVFGMMIAERKREFAILRVLGMNRRMLSGMVLKESLIVSAVGGAAGIAAASLMIFPFSGLLEQKLGLPFLMPGAGTLLGLAALAMAASLLAGPASAAWAAYRVSNVDTGIILREN